MFQGIGVFISRSPTSYLSDDITGWQDCVMKELEKKHKQERDFFIDLLKDPEIEDIRDEAKNMSEEERFERIAKLKDKREELDLEDKCKYIWF